MLTQKKSPTTNVKLSRKQLRKEKRKGKKIRRHEFYTNRKKPGQFVRNTSIRNDASEKPFSEENTSPRVQGVDNEKSINKQNTKCKEKPLGNPISTNRMLTTEEQRRKDQQMQKIIQKKMIQHRSKQLLEANIDEDRTIRQLEKQLKIKKKKSKSIPKTFVDDGLDYLLQVCDPETMKNVISAEQEINDVNDDFEEDLALITNYPKTSSQILDECEDNVDDKEDSDEEEDIEENENLLEDINGFSSDDSNEYNQGNDVGRSSLSNKDSRTNKDSNKNNILKTIKKRKASDDIVKSKKKSKLAKETEDYVVTSNNEIENSDGAYSDDGNEKKTKGAIKNNPDGTWEDIYGRTRTADGAIIESISNGKYIPPSMRAKIPEDNKRMEDLNRLNKQLKGLLNRLAESNMHNIATQIENLYMNNSRNDMNDTLTNLIMQSLVSRIITPERLLMEHVMLVTILHSNVGSEVGAHFLQCVAKQFDEFFKSGHDVENKMLDNVVNIIAQLYNFKMFDSKLVYEVLEKLSNNFKEKDVECILHILRNVGFSLRKESPLSFKKLILDLQKRAASVSEEEKNNSRVKFMLDILLAIKNNNVTKIPNYDTSYSEHLKKLIKGFIRKGNYVTQLNISLEDLLKAEDRGKWWVVGSAWTGNAPKVEIQNITKTKGYSEKLLELARKQRMNTDTRRNIFCIIMSAEDYIDAFEKLLHLGLKNQQEREIIHVILHCCLQEKTYNPYYTVLTQRFCEYDRKFQMIIKCSVWDKLKSLNSHSGTQISSLAKLLTHLFLEKSLPISTLKIMEFSELDKITLRFMRQILLAILLTKETDSCLSVFEKVGHSDKLKMFRESLKLFIHHFMLKNLKSENIPEDQKILLETRAKMVEKLLSMKKSQMDY